MIWFGNDLILTLRWFGFATVFRWFHQQLWFERVWEYKTDGGHCLFACPAGKALRRWRGEKEGGNDQRKLGVNLALFGSDLNNSSINELLWTLIRIASNRWFDDDSNWSDC